MARKTKISNVDTRIITFNRDNRHLICVDRSSRARLGCAASQWKVDDGTKVGSFKMDLPERYVIYAMAASMDGRWIVTGDSENQVIVWDAVTHAIASQISEHAGHVSALDVSSDSTRIVSGSADSTVRIFNILSRIRLLPPLTLGNSVTPTDVKFSPDGSQVATAMQSGFRIYDAQFGNKLFNFPVENTSISSLAWSLDGQQLLVSSPGRISRFDTPTFASSHLKLRWIINDDINGYRTFVLTHGRFLACATGLWVSFWDYTSGKQIGSIIDHPTAINRIFISPNGRYLACVDQRGITVYHLTDILPGDYLHAKDSDPSYHAHTLAARSIIWARLGEWSTAIEDAEMSLQINQSPLGQIARSLALVGTGEEEIALDDFYFAFRDDPRDTTLLLVIMSILSFMCGKHKQAISRLQHLITTADEKTKGYYIPVLGNLYLKQRDYKNAVQTFVLAKNSFASQDSDPLMTITLIFDWNFDHLEDIAYQRLCESLYPSGRVKEVGETLLKMVSGMPEGEREAAHGRILEELVTRSGQVTLLMWVGKSSRSNTCLPNSPAVYIEQPFVSPHPEPAELTKRTDELRAVFSFADALAIYLQATRFQPVRFARFHLHLPCIVFSVKSLGRKDANLNIYHAETAEFGEVEFTTADLLPLNEPQRLVFADLRIHGLRLESDTEWTSSDVENSVVGTGTDLAHVPMIEEVPSCEPQIDTYTRALRLIARLGQPFSALLLLRQSDGSYKRVASDHEIVIGGTGNQVPKDIRVEVLEIL